MPSIFKRRRILVNRKKKDQNTRIKKNKKSSQDTSNVSDEVIPIDDDCKDDEGRGGRGEAEGGTSEQRLPLKKRHHHLQVSLDKTYIMEVVSYIYVEIK